MNYPFKTVINDIRNYFFIKNLIKKNKGTVEWEQYKLRVDWLGRIYTVVNLPPEVIYSPDSPEEIRPAFVLEESRPLNEYLTRLNLQEIVMPSISPIPNSFSCLLVYSPYFQKLSTRWVVYRTILLLVILWAQHKFGIISWLFGTLKYLWNVIF
jgi:hypothetical protein